MTTQQPQYTNRSRLSLASPAIRPGMKGRMLLSGPAGAGKTYTALLIASILAGPERVTRSIVMVDTEKDSGKTYADLFRLADGSEGYMHLSWGAPYNATDLAMTLREASDSSTDVVIVDSHSHFWRAQGGILDVANGKWTGWNEARPMHADMIDAILSCDCHVILCARSTMEHVQEKDERTGKTTIRKVGMKVQQDAELEYEMNIALEIDMPHTLHVSKSRTLAVPVGTQYIAGHAEQFAGDYRDWLVGGEPVTSKEQQDNLVAVLNRIEDAANRGRSKRLFMDVFGRPEMLLISRLAEAEEWVANQLLGVGDEGGGDRAPDEVPADERGKQPEPTEAERKAAQETAPAPSGDGAPKPAEEQSGDQGAPGEPPEPTPAEVRKALENEVKAVSPVAVTTILADRGLPLTGAPAAQRKRLVDFLLDVRDGTRTDPKACAECGGATTDVCPPGQTFCKCGTI